MNLYSISSINNFMQKIEQDSSFHNYKARFKVALYLLHSLISGKESIKNIKRPIKSLTFLLKGEGSITGIWYAAAIPCMKVALLVALLILSPKSLHSCAYTLFKTYCYYKISLLPNFSLLDGDSNWRKKCAKFAVTYKAEYKDNSFADLCRLRRVYDLINKERENQFQNDKQIDEKVKEKIENVKDFSLLNEICHNFGFKKAQYDLPDLYFCYTQKRALPDTRKKIEELFLQYSVESLFCSFSSPKNLHVNQKSWRKLCQKLDSYCNQKNEIEKEGLKQYLYAILYLCQNENEANKRVSGVVEKMEKNELYLVKALSPIERNSVIK